MSPIIAELIEKLNSGNSAGVPPTTTTTPLFKNNSTLENSALASKHFTGSSGYFVKANRFQFQNSWTSTEAPPPTQSTSSSSTSAVTPPVVYFTSQRNFAPTPAKTTPQPPSTSSTSTSTTIITSTPTPTTLAVPATVRVITSPSTTTGVHSLHPPNHHHPNHHHLHHHQSRPEVMSARKHGSQSGNGNQESSSAHQLSAATTVDMSQVASIIIGFCVAMMALAGKQNPRP